jgi:hypothetical protein
MNIRSRMTSAPGGSSLRLEPLTSSGIVDLTALAPRVGLRTVLLLRLQRAHVRPLNGTRSLVLSTEALAGGTQPSIEAVASEIAWSGVEDRSERFEDPPEGGRDRCSHSEKAMDGGRNRSACFENRVAGGRKSKRGVRRSTCYGGVRFSG